MENQDTIQTEQQEGVAITPDAVQHYLNTDEGKRLLQPMLDRYHSKGLEAWRTNNLQKLIDEGISKANPQETPEQKAVRELKAELDSMRKAATLEAVKNKAIVHANDKKLPLEFIDILVEEDEKVTFDKLNLIESVFNTHVQRLVDEEVKKRLGESSQRITGNDNKNVVVTKEMFAAMLYDDRVKLRQDNPDLYKELSK